MTAIPPVNANNQNLLNRGIQALQQLNTQLTTLNTRGLANLQSALVRFGDTVGNFAHSFSKADNLQKRSLAAGTSLNKLLKVNNDTLKGLRGDYFENAEELLENYTYGIRQNSTSLNGLMNRMKLTGQSTELLRTVMADVQVATGGTNDVMDRLIMTNEKLSSNSTMFNETMLRALDAIKSTAEVPSFIGLGEEIRDLTMSLTKMGGEKTLSQISKVVDFLYDPNQLSSRISLGVGNADELLNPLLSTEERAQKTVELLNTATSNLRRLTSVGDSSYKTALASYQLSNYGDKSNLIALTQLTDVINVNKNLTSDLVDQTAKYNETAETIQKEALNFFNYANSFAFRGAIAALPTLTGGSVGANVGSFIGNIFGRNLGANVAGLGGTLLRSAGVLARFAGPIGAAIGGLSFFGPMIYDWFTKSDKTAQEANKHLASLDSKTPTPKRDDAKLEVGGNFSQFMANLIRDIATGPESSKNEQLSQIGYKLDELIRIQEYSKSKSSLIPNSTINF